MSTLERCAAVSISCCTVFGLLMTLSLVVVAETAGNSPRSGRALSTGAVHAMELHVFPDGEGLPGGAGSVAAGEVLYGQQCQVCHGPKGQGASAEELAGGQMALTSDWPDKTIGTYWPYATTLFDFIRRSMPMTAPGSLSDDEVYALTAYLLHINGVIDENVTLDAASVAAVRMPNRDGFIPQYPGVGELP